MKRSNRGPPWCRADGKRPAGGTDAAHGLTGSRVPCVVIAGSLGARLTSVRVFLVFLDYSIRYATTESFHIISRSLIITQVCYHAALCSLSYSCPNAMPYGQYNVPQSVIAVIVQYLPM